jgi:predicted permease
VRLALGASRRDVVRQVMVESLLLAIVAGGAALAVGRVSLAWLTIAKPMNVTGFWSRYARTFDFFDVSLDWRMALFTMALALGTGVVFGILPARQAARMQLNDALKMRAGSTRLGARAALVLAEIGFSVVLLASAGLMVRSFANAARVDLGFTPDRLVSTSIAMQQRKPVEFYGELLARVRAVAGVEAAALATGAPLGGGTSILPIEIEGRPKEAGDIRAGLNVVTPGFFATLGIQLRRGRPFRDDDRDPAPRVAVISDSLARQAWPGQDPVGKRFKHDVRAPLRSFDGWTTVVGVVDDAVYGELEDPTTPMLYLPAWQPLGSPGALAMAPDTIVVRSDLGTAVVPGLREALHGLDPTSPVYDAAPMEARAAGTQAASAATVPITTAMVM